MKLGAGRLAGIVILALVSAVCWLDLAASGDDRAPPSPSVPAAWGELTPARRSTRASFRLPNPILALAALTENARTTLIGVRPNGTQSLLEPEVMDGGSTTLRGSALAYLLLPGLDPSQNYIEAHDLAEGRSWEILPDEGGVIFGFVMDPAGTHLVYLEVDARPSGAQPPWRVVAVDLASGTRRAILDGARDGEVALLPVDWESDTILLRGLTPFSPRFHGLWSVQSDGAGLRKLLDESDYVATPRLSPQGDRLALLSAQPSVRPPLIGRGEPSATVVQVFELSTDRRIPILVTDSQHEFADLQWQAGGLLAVQGEWDEEQQAFVHRRVLHLGLGANASPEVLYSAVDGDILRLARCPDKGWLAVVQGDNTVRIVGGNQTEPIASFHHGDLDSLTCLAGPPSDSGQAMAGRPSGLAWAMARR